MITIEDIDFSGKKALIRVDFNVPLNDQFLITDDTRIRAALPTIQKILNDGGCVVLMSHLGRPKNGPEEKFSLKHLVPYLNNALNVEVKFANDCIGEEAFELSKALKAGEVLLLENLRFYKEEKKGDEAFAEKLSKHGDIYVNDAFGTAHRAHASTAVIAKYFKGKKCFGSLMANEIRSIDKVLENPQSPLVAVMGGAKVSDKIEIIDKLLGLVDTLIIGGGMAYTFFKAMGKNIGSSICEEEKLELAKHVMQKAEAKGVKLLLPKDTIVADKFDNNANVQSVSSGAIPDGWMGLDIGKDAAREFAEELYGAKTILWNGPMGVFEMENFQFGTREVAEAVARATENGSYSLVGGGDSVAAIKKYNLGDRVSYVSTGGGALLEYLEGKELPGIKAIGK